MSDAAALSTRDVWAVADNSTTVRRWNGTAWSARALPIRARAIDATAASNVWAGAYRIDAQGNEQPAAVRWEDGTAWKEISPPTITLPAGEDSGARFRDITAISPTNVWAVGSVDWLDSAARAHSKPLLAHYTGGKWYTWVTAEAPRYENVVHDGQDGIHIAQGEWNPTVLHGRDGVWTRMALPRPSGYQSNSSTLARNPVTGTLWSGGWFQVDSDGASTSVYWRQLAS